MPEIQRLRLDHAAALLLFERENRAYFAAAIPDRGDEYFTNFVEELRSSLAEQATGTCHFHVIMDGADVIGRINLFGVADGAAELGFRVARKAAGRGLAQWAVGQIVRGGRGRVRADDTARQGDPAERGVARRPGPDRF